MQEPITESQLKQRGFRLFGKHKTYKYVSVYTNHRAEIMWKVSIPPSVITGGSVGIFDSEREAAKFVDIKLIKAGKEPVNILKKVS